MMGLEYAGLRCEQTPFPFILIPVFVVVVRRKRDVVRRSLRNPRCSIAALSNVGLE